MTRPSKAEQKLIDFSREAFGEHLSTLLLCGYGEEHRLTSCDFAVELTGDESRERQLRLLFVAEGPVDAQPSLPQGKEPLVLLALLQLLMRKGEEQTCRLTYTYNDLLKLLGWGNTAQSRARIGSAVTKYFHIFYQLHEDSLDEAMKTGDERIRKIRALVGQDFAGTEETSLISSVMNAVTFNIDFVESLKDKRFLGIDWNQVEHVIPLPVEFFNL